MIEGKALIVFPENYAKYLKVGKFTFYKMEKERKILSFKIKEIQKWKLK